MRDVNELLVEIGFDGADRPRRRARDLPGFMPPRARPAHQDAPRELLRSIPGLELTEMATPDRCCGSAGIYNITQTEMSRQVLDQKMDRCYVD